MLQAMRKLQTREVEIFFEKENLWLLEEKMQMLLTMYYAFAQADYITNMISVGQSQPEQLVNMPVKKDLLNSWFLHGICFSKK